MDYLKKYFYLPISKNEKNKVALKKYNETRIDKCHDATKKKRLHFQTVE